MVALMVASFTVVRHVVEEKETIFLLPPPARPQAVRAPVVIDGRGKPPPATAAPSAALPAYAQPGFHFSTPQGKAPASDLSREIARCRIENYASLTSSERAACLQPEMARQGPAIPPPDKPVKNEGVWQAELARKNAPFALPGAQAGILGMLGALFSGAFSDKRNYSYGPPDPEPMDGAEMARQYALHGSGCSEGLDDASRKNCRINIDSTPMLALGGMVYPSHPHVSDAAFNQALAAVQARKQSLYGQPVLASGANKGGGGEKNNSSGGAGAATGGGAGSPGR